MVSDSLKCACGSEHIPVSGMILDNSFKHNFRGFKLK